MKVAIGQLNIRQGELKRNFAAVKRMTEEAKKEGAELIVFPELCLSGLCTGDHWNHQDFRDSVDAYNEQTVELADSIAILFGSSFCRSGLLFSGAYLAVDRQLVKASTGLEAAVKTEPGFKGYHEENWFAFGAGKQHFDAEINGQKVRIAVSFTDEASGGDLNVILGHDPYLFNERKIRNGLYVNPVGSENTGKAVFGLAGNSGFYNKGRKQWGCRHFEEELKVCELDAREEVPAEKTLLLDALTMILREFDAQQFASSMKWIIGLSGGLDSSICAALLVKALGPDRVVGYNMASSYNSVTTKGNARQLADNLGMQIREGSIVPLVEATKQIMNEYGYTEEYPSLVYENIQARIRGHLLSTFASVENGVIYNNGNKIETALGYCTLYGDSIGALCTLSDLTKVQLFDLAREINSFFGKEVIPVNLLPEVIGDTVKWEMPPSAELRDNQFDPMKWFYHDWLVDGIMKDNGFLLKVMSQYESGAIFNMEIGHWLKYYGLDDPEAFINDLQWILKCMKRNVFKRIQSPPVVAFSDYAYGVRNECQQNPDDSLAFQELRARILAKKTH